MPSRGETMKNSTHNKWKMKHKSKTKWLRKQRQRKSNTHDSNISIAKNKRQSIERREQMLCAWNSSKSRHHNANINSSTAVHKGSTKRTAIYMHKHAYNHRLNIHTDGTVFKLKMGKIENYESMLQSVNDATSNRTDVNFEVACFLLLSTSSPYHCHQPLCCRVFCFC